MLRAIEHSREIAADVAVDFGDQRRGQRTIEKRAVIASQEPLAEPSEESFREVIEMGLDDEGQVLQSHPTHPQRWRWLDRGRVGVHMRLLFGGGAHQRDVVGFYAS